MKTFLQWILEYKHRTFGHPWRPALTSRGPARACICGRVEDLTVADFYAQFGIMPNVGIIAR